MNLTALDIEDIIDIRRDIPHHIPEAKLLLAILSQALADKDIFYLTNKSDGLSMILGALRIDEEIFLKKTNKIFKENRNDNT